MTTAFPYNNAMPISAATWSGGIANITTPTPIGLNPGTRFRVLVAGAIGTNANQSYNGVFTATANGTNNFLYATSPDPGSLLAGPKGCYTITSQSFPGLSNIIPSYLYRQYADDTNLSALVQTYNAMANAYAQTFATVNLPVYTEISGTLLTWMAKTLYGIDRPSGMTDDTLRRVITWNHYLGDGMTCNISWLKRRVIRFCGGVNGGDLPGPGLAPLYYNACSVGVVRNPPGSVPLVTISITIVTSSTVVPWTATIVNTLRSTMASGYLVLPSFYAITVL
jgi:hypothetical protein